MLNSDQTSSSGFIGGGVHDAIAWCIVQAVNTETIGTLFYHQGAGPGTGPGNIRISIWSATGLNALNIGSLLQQTATLAILDNTDQTVSGSITPVAVTSGNFYGLAMFTDQKYGFPWMGTIAAGTDGCGIDDLTQPDGTFPTWPSTLTHSNYYSGPFAIWGVSTGPLPPQCGKQIYVLP